MGVQEMKFTPTHPHPPHTHTPTPFQGFPAGSWNQTSRPVAGSSALPGPLCWGGTKTEWASRDNTPELCITAQWVLSLSAMLKLTAGLQCLLKSRCIREDWTTGSRHPPGPGQDMGLIVVENGSGTCRRPPGGLYLATNWETSSFLKSCLGFH